MCILAALAVGASVYAESERAATIRRVVKSSVVVGVDGIEQDALGSGTVIGTALGYSFVLTCHHVIADALSIRVFPYGKPSIDAFVEIDSPDTDLALLVVHTTLPVLSVSSALPELYDTVYLIGAPDGEIASASEAMVTSLDYGVGGQMMYRVTNGLMQPGISGGTATNTRGELIGVPARASKSTPQQGLLVGLKDIRAFVGRYAGSQ